MDSQGSTGFGAGSTHSLEPETQSETPTSEKTHIPPEQTSFLDQDKADGMQCGKSERTRII